ncbi:MAG: amidohydrolase family protein [Candidatus Riflebacteria bacterium]|nr:amidohydrolase family protein [Candidatus Riflebacteria bacterium]
MQKLLENARVLTPDFTIWEGNILVSGERIAGLLAKSDIPGVQIDQQIDLKEKLVFPSLINSHDHLYDSFWPPFNGLKYNNWFEWDSAFRASENFINKQKLSVADLYSLGMYKNVLSGTGLIVDHFPLDVVSNFFQKPLVNLLEHFFLAHSASTKSPEWGAGLKEEFRKTRGILPFVLHVEEGFDPEILQEIETINRMDVLADNTVIINGIGLSDADLELICSKNASLVWCPVANNQVFGKDTPIGNIFKKGIKCALGTDSSIKGSLGIMDDLRFGLKVLREKTFLKDPQRTLLEMTTSIPAEIFRISKDYGSIEKGKIANFLIFEDLFNDPLNSFFDLSPSKISLLMNRGNLVYGEEEYRAACSLDFEQYSETLVEGKTKIIWGHPIQLLSRVNNKLGQPQKFGLLPLSEE